MNTAEAKTILANELSRYRKQSYADLLSLRDRPESFERVTPSGTVYQLEINVFFDDDSNTALRISGAIDDGKWRAFKPLCDDFLMSPDGSFVGE